MKIKHSKTNKTLKILFILDHPGFLIHFDSVIMRLAERGHRIDLAFTRLKKKKFENSPEEIVKAAGDKVRILSCANSRGDVYGKFVASLRDVADYLHYLKPPLKGAIHARERFSSTSKLPRILAFLRRKHLLPDKYLLFAEKLVNKLEQAIPSSAQMDRFIRDSGPHDLVILCPLVTRKPPQRPLVDYLKSIKAMKIPSALCLGGWDNLSSKGLLRVKPDRIVVWNETQKREAVDFHGASPDSVVTTGAQQFDRWFDRTPGTTKAEFCDRVGLPADRPFVMFTCSTKLTLSDHTEKQFVTNWIKAIRDSSDRELSSIGILIRPHPNNVKNWKSVDFSEFGPVVVWNRGKPLPIEDSDRGEYFDSLYHSSAIVGINSSSMIEAAIVDRPVHTVVLPELAVLQGDLLHFHYLLPEKGGFLREAHSLEEHTRLLTEDLHNPDLCKEQNQSFVRSFIRPHGLDNPALPYMVEAIESLASAR